MAHWWHARADALRALLAQVDVLFVDEDELAQATGDTDSTSAVARVLALGPEVVVVKRGARGAWMQRRDGAPVATAAAPVREVVDTTGAGDAFAGGFMAALAQQPPLSDHEVLRMAAAIAAFAVEGVGPAALLAADRAAVQRRLGG
jgi:sugar/nucleoside kinase (ribokinase family)